MLERHLALEQAFSDSPLTAGNKVQLLLDGPATYRAMFAAIASAHDHINMETYILEDDEVGERFATALIAKQSEGVQVDLIRDSVGTLGTSAAYWKHLSDAGIKLLEFNPVNPLNAKVGWDVNQRDHRKLLIVDGRIAFLGGINISSVYSGSSFGLGSRPRAGNKQPWRDTDLQIEGPVVAEYQKLFIETWQKQKGVPLAERGVLPDADAPGQRGRACDRQLARRTLQRDVRDADLGDRRSRNRDPADQRVLRARSAADRGDAETRSRAG